MVQKMNSSLESYQLGLNLQKDQSWTFNLKLLIVVYDRNHLFGLGSDTETETEHWPKL